MINTVTLANDNAFETDGSESILAAASRKGFTLEYSCRTGRCGTCKSRVLRGNTQLLQPEEYLSEQKKSQGYILTCCRSATTDVLLDIEDLGELGELQVKTLPCRIDNLQLLSEDVIEVILRTPPNSSLDYLPGQYVDMIGGYGLRRSYSIANAPRKDGKITLHIRKVPNGEMSHYWFNEARVNDLLRMEGPLGTFCLRKSGATHLVLLATGTGISPIKAILEHLSATPEDNPYSEIRLYWGGRSEADIYWWPDFPALPINFAPVLSRDTGWKGRKGHVQQAVIADAPKLTDTEVYACGSEVMIRSAYDCLTAAGLCPRKYYSDAFVSSN